MEETTKLMEERKNEKAPVQKPESESQDSKFDRHRRVIGAICGPICALLVWITPISGLSAEAHNLLAVMTLVALWWITEPVPIPVTSLIGPTLCVVLGIVKMKDAFSAFANPMIFLFMGGFVIAKAMMVNGLDKRIAYGIMSMKWVGDSPRRIFLAIGLACMLCSGWISNTATAARQGNQPPYIQICHRPDAYDGLRLLYRRCAYAHRNST